MEFSQAVSGRQDALADLFTDTFTATEGPEEGRLIGALSRSLLQDTPAGDIRVFTAVDGGSPVAAAIFTRLRYGQDPRKVFLLSPMAVATGRQGQGIGQALLSHALQGLRAEGADAAITYGDPAFYGKAGFRPLGEDIAPAPFPLSQPEGWIGQSLTGTELAPFAGPCRCAAALADPTFW